MPQPEGQLVFNSWMPGGTLPRTPGDVVAVFEIGCGLFSHYVCKYDGKQLRVKDTDKTIDAEPVRWMVLPEVVSDSDTGEGTK